MQQLLLTTNVGLSDTHHSQRRGATRPTPPSRGMLLPFRAMGISLICPRYNRKCEDMIEHETGMDVRFLDQYPIASRQHV